jgi:hypothetical protein
MKKASKIFGDCRIDDLPKSGIDFLINALDINEKSLEVEMARKLDINFNYTKEDMKSFADWCRNALLNTEYSYLKLDEHLEKWRQLNRKKIEINNLTQNKTK